MSFTAHEGSDGGDGPSGDGEAWDAVLLPSAEGASVAAAAADYDERAHAWARVLARRDARDVAPQGLRPRACEACEAKGFTPDDALRRTVETAMNQKNLRAWHELRAREWALRQRRTADKRRCLVGCLVALVVTGALASVAALLVFALV